MRIGIKYCGGCNSHYDRSRFVQRLAEQFPEVVFLSIMEKNLDHILVIHGCRVQCANQSGLESKGGLIQIHQAEDFEEVSKIIKKFLQKEK